MLTFKWMSPFIIQCFVSAGVSINMGSSGLVTGFSSVLLPQLRQSNSTITIDDSLGSWIASLPGIGLFLGNFIVTGIMNQYGRKLPSLISLVIGTIGWLSITFAQNVYVLITARFIQGVSSGMIMGHGSVIIGEYTSPKHRGLFLMSINTFVSFAVFLIHIIGLYLKWQLAAAICIGITIFNLIIVLCSPESPTFLAQEGKYEQCRKTFRFLRGDNEEEELEKLIAASMNIREKVGDIETEKGFKGIKMYYLYLMETMRKKEIYKPIIIMLHIYIMLHWCSINTISSYTVDLFDEVVGIENIDLPLMVITLDVQRNISSFVGMVIIKKFRRRTILFAFCGLNVIFLMISSLYTYAKEKDWLVYDNYVIGILLIHLILMTTMIGAVPLSFVIAGEVLPMEHRTLCGGICTFFFAANIFVVLKTIPFLFNTTGVYGSFLISAIIMLYGMLVLGIMLPETKDRTLQDIEEELRGK